MLRSLALISLATGSLFWAGCSDDNTKINYPPVITPDMATGDGTGGNGGTGGTGGGGGGTGGVGGGGGGMTSMDMGPMLPDLAGLPAPDHSPTEHPTLPTMGTTFSANSTIKNPEIWTVVWTGDDALGAKVNAFNTWMLGSDYWKNGLKDYGVGAGTAKGVIVLQNSPPPTMITDGQLQTIITQNLGVAGSGWPTKNANTVISFVLDPKTVDTSNGGSCTVYDGYHGRTATGKTPYLVNAYCPDANMQPDWNNLTVTMSHEAAEAASDYDLNHNRVQASGGIDYLGGGEDGDMCLSLNASIAADASTTYLVQRLWSNSIAVANNGDPCIPVETGTQWFGAGLIGNSVINITRDSSGKASTPFKIEAWEMDPSFGPIGFYIVGSFLPAGVTITPNIAITTSNGTQTGAVQYLNAGGTFNGTINVSSAYQPDGQPITMLIISRNETKTHYNIWWGMLLIN